MMMHGNMPFVWQTGTGRLSVKVGDEAEGRKRPTSTSTLGFDCTGKLLFIEAGQQQKNDRYLCMWSPTALTNKHIHMHIEPISSFPFLHFFFMIFKQISLPCEHKRTQSKKIPSRPKTRAGGVGWGTEERQKEGREVWLSVERCTACKEIWHGSVYIR